LAGPASAPGLIPAEAGSPDPEIESSISRNARLETAFDISPKRGDTIVTTAEAEHYFVIPLSVQKDGDDYLVGNAEMGDFYQFPEQGLKILEMLGSGKAPAAIKSRLETEDGEKVDVDAFVELLSSIGFIHPEGQKPYIQQRLQAATQDRRRVFDVDPRIAKAVFSAQALFGCGCLVALAAFEMIRDPALRINFNAFYTETNRTPLLLILMGFSLLQVTLHEVGHMLAAAKYGIKSRYGFGNRLWSIVAESDLTALLSLPKSQRYFPMLAGLLVDVVCISLLTLLLAVMLRNGAGPYAVQITQAFVLEIWIGMAWQCNIFVKTDVYFLLSNFFSYPDIDNDARIYINHLTHRLTFGLLGSAASTSTPRNRLGVQIFAAIWLLGRILSLFILLGVFLPTMARYLISAIEMLKGPPASIWMACDTLMYVAISLGMVSVGMYMWIKKK
jgi:putative peptide zinc metalloprotease protein